MAKKATVDIAIIGGGIAGLWALNRLKNLGFSVILLESETLGGGQTIKSQGIIHGGLKYALKGMLTGASSAIESAPARWQACLKGQGEINLESVKTLSPSQLLWSTGGLASNITSFFGAQALNSRVKKLKIPEFPPLLQNPNFRGQVFQLEEMVLDIPSLIEALVKPHYENIYKMDSNQSIEIESQCTIFTSGEGNQKFLNKHEMQCRPLHMVLMKLKENYPFFGHCIGRGANPRITITTHTSSDGQYIWYLGGQLAEDGINRTEEEQIAFAKKELNTLFPWMNFSDAIWRSFLVNRAEAKQPGNKRPECPFVETIGSSIIAWPTKLALAPVLGDKILEAIQKMNLQPKNSDLSALENLNQPSLSKPVWDELFNPF